MLRLGTVAKPLLHEFRNAWSRHIRMQYTQRFHKKCPRSLHRLQSLSFLPQVLGSTAPWAILDIRLVANRCGVHASCFSGLESVLANALDMSSEFSALCTKVLEYRLEKKQDCCTSLKHITTWNVSGWRRIQWTSDKSRLIHRYAKKGVVCLQETRWSDSTATSFLQNYPGYNLVHTSALVTDQGGLSGGTAILIPCSFRLSREVVVAPGRIVAAHIQSRADSCWIVSTYCHPTSAGQDLETLTAWIAEHQDESDPFFILGDFNHGQISAPSAWQRLLEMSQVEDIVNDEPTYWGPHGTSSLDKVLLPIDYLNRGLIQYQTFYDCHFETAGHACVTVQLKHRPPVASSQDLPIHMTLPAAVFQPGKDRHDTRCVWPSLTALIRRISLLEKPTFESLQSLLWQWWMSLPSRPRDFHTLRKYLQSNHPMLNVSQQLLHELLAALPGFHPTLSDFCQSTTTITVPRTFLWRCFELLDLQIQQQHWITRNRAETHRSRGLGTMAPLWQRLRASCPRSVFYNGPIQDGEGQICRTDKDLSAAMLATRKFWFQPPPRYDSEWADYLEQYKTQAQQWPRVPPPGENDFVKSILASNDSAPGPDGIPYAAWRIYPRPVAIAMTTHLEDICRGGTPPPCSVQAWIPKAKMGPTADNFRPLGMPSTFERVIDGTVASALTKVVAPLLHPSQTVLNLFREPQSAVQSVQTILDQSLPCAVLSLDLSKAFERINPYWILQILAACKAPLWIITYTRHILLFRRSRHKVQGRLLPSKMIVTGVDMGRSFSVLLFCIAMDPILTYLNRIPGVLTVQGYVDDTTLAGDTAAGMQWLSDVWNICKKLRTAGIQIDEHHCWRANGARMNAPQSGCLADFPALDWVHNTRGHATLYQALARRAGRLTTTLASRGQNFVCLTPTQVDQILAGNAADNLTDLFLTQCGCANKCSVLVNHQAAQNTLNALERSNWGAHLIEGKATALGLILYGRFSRSKQGWAVVRELEGTNAINPKAMTKANHRLALFTTPAHSIIQRSLANNCFILSLNIYQSTYFGFNWNDINLYQQRTAKLLLGRPWITARYLPHIFRWLGIAPTLDPAVTLTAACLGYWLRQNGTAAILPPGCPEAETRQGAVVQRVFQSWIPLLGVAKTGQLLNIIAGQCTRKQHTHFLLQLKKALYEAIQVHALRYLHTKVNRQLLPGGVSWTWVTKLASLPKLAVNGIARFAVLRWAVNEDDDECLRLRVQGNLQAERPCLICAVHTRLYPMGLQFHPMCEKCCHDCNVNATTIGSEQRWGLPPASRWFQVADAVQGISSANADWTTLDRHLPPCVACGLGDNSTQHWARFCIIPVLVANELTPASQRVSSLDQLARTSNTGCVIASHILHQFRRLLLEHGGMQHAESAVQLGSNEWATRLYDNTITAIPVRYLPPHAELIRPHQPDPHCRPHPCLLKETSNEAVSLQSVALPDLICTATTAIQDGQTIAVLSVGHPWLRLIIPPQWQSAGLLPNATITRAQGDPTKDTAEDTCAVIALKSIEPDEMILVNNRPEPSNTVIQLVGQFDGSSLREEQIGGAGYVIHAVEQGRSRVLALRSVCLPDCTDNIEAEILACQYLSEELADTTTQLLAQGYHRPQVVIQGDILPVIKYFQFAARLRRIDMTQPLERIPVVPARGGAEVALKIYKTFLIYRTCMRRAPAKPVRACTLRKMCPASHVTCEAPLRTSHSTLHTSHFTLHSSHSKLHTPHFTLLTSHFSLHTSHSTLHTPHFTLHASHFSLLSSDSTLHTSHFTRHSPHFTLLIAFFTLHTSSLHREALTHSKLSHTASIYTQNTYTQCFYTWKALTHTHTETFTQRRFYTQRSFYTQQTFNTQNFYTQQAFTHSKRLHTVLAHSAFTHGKRLHTEHLHTVLLHMASVYTHRNFYTETLVTHEQISFYTQQTFTHTQLLHIKPDLDAKAKKRRF